MPDVSVKADRPLPQRPWFRWVAALGCLAVAFGVLVGVAHWRMDRLENEDVVRSVPTDLDGPSGLAFAAVGGTAYGVDDRDTVAVVPLGHGPARHVGSADLVEVRPGRSGDFAVAGVHDVALYDATGRKLWSVPVTAGAVTAIGKGDATILECRGDHLCDLVHVDAGGKIDARTPTDYFSDLASAGAPVAAADPDVRIAPAPSLPVQLRGGRAFPVVDGRPVGPGVRRDEDATVAVAGDVLVGLSHSGTTCHYEAVRGSKPLWKTDVDCSDLDPEHGFEFPKVWTFPHRLGVMYGTISNTDPRPYVSIDLADGKVSRPAAPRLGTDARAWLTPHAIVRLHAQRLVAYSQTSGKRLWSIDLPSKAAARSVRVSGSVITWDSHVSRLWPALALGHEHDGAKATNEAITYVDATTGDRFATVAGGWSYDTVGIGTRRALLAINGRLKVID